MDDESGKLIDGTARARQWRRSRSGSARADGPETRSAAPKSIAASLLVPAEMLGPATSPGTEAHHLATATNEVSHINPFLVPEAFGADREDTIRKSGRRWWLAPAATVRREAPLAIPIALALAAVAAVAVVMAGGGRSGSSGGLLAQSLSGSGTATSLGHLKPGIFASNPFGVIKSTSRSTPSTRARAASHPSRTNALRTRRAVRHPTAGVRAEGRHSDATVVDHNATASPVTPAVTQPAESSPAPTSTVAPARSVVSQHPSSSSVAAEPAASSRRPAFGSDGLLGPGSSPDS